MPDLPSQPLLWGFALLIADLLLWQWAPFAHQAGRVGVRVALFLGYSAVIMAAGISPLQPPPWPDNTLWNLAATGLAIIWWLYGARTLGEVLGLILTRRIGHSGRLLRDVLGAVVFLIAVVAAAGYVLQLPVKGLLATSGAVAIIVGLALQSTLSDVFSGIVLNTTKPYQVDDWVAIDGTEGKVTDIDWRATHLLTTAGATAVVPNSVAAKARIVNYSRPAGRHGVTITVSVPNAVRPGRVLEALERALRGSHALLPDPPPRALVKEAGEDSTEYTASGFVANLASKGEVRNQLFDLAHRHLEAAGVTSHDSGPASTRKRALLDEVKVFRALASSEKDRLADALQARDVPAGQVILDVGEVPANLFIIGAGVVSAAIANGDTFIEAGRMGPGEVMGEQSVLDDTPSQARFTALTSCTLYSVDKALTRECVAARAEVGKALQKLQAVRRQSSQSLLLQRPAPVRKGGFLGWLQRH
ncbi:mechanosensitive ion channel domain-containing protein [Pseudomonas japonica]|uniref:mechanosensitive ion channel domain-containing protein n=1 Tax=Pseudomonas japonica TaxID=256466 RepID=UPI0015E28BE2|nr:mechanosensitive ion channel domain-containing protein [Pseudomonas japonica]MBA1288929.1 mechanosensitive ion channel [Pseudomonas japonica]